MRTRFTKSLAALLPAALAAALVWYNDVYAISWRHRQFPLAAITVTVGVAALTLLTLRSRGERRPLTLVKDWSAERPVALLGHSFGGPTANLFAQLCEEGSAAEMAAGQVGISPLFTGELKGRVLAVVTLAGVLNGTTAAEPYIAEEGGIPVFAEYVDDGVSGVTFGREGFKRMVADIEEGRLDTVICKDLSRLGRNNAMVAYYTEV